MAVEFNDHLQSLLDLLEDSPSKDTLMSLISTPSAHLPLGNTMALKDEYGDHGPWGDQLLLLMHHLLGSEHLAPSDKKRIKESLSVLWNGHEKLSQVASLHMSPVGVAWVPSQGSASAVRLPKVVGSIALFLEHKADRYGITLEEITALRSILHHAEEIFPVPHIYGNIYTDYSPNLFHEIPDKVTHTSRGTAVQHWADAVMKDVITWTHHFTRWGAPEERFFSTKLRDKMERSLSYQDIPLRASELSGIPAALYVQRSNLTPALVFTAYALAVEYNEEWAASAI